MPALPIIPTAKQLFFSILMGIACGLLLINLDKIIKSNLAESHKNYPSLLSVSKVQAEEMPLVNNETTACLPITLGYQEEEESPKALVKGVATDRILSPVKPQNPRKLIVSETLPPVPENPENPNSVVIHISQAPLPASAKKVNGKWVCAIKNDKPHKSDKNKKGHIDRQCCLDPDEIPNPHCDYSYKP